MAEEKTFSVGVQTSSPKRISVTSNVSENPITASADTGLYYSQLAKNWAIGEGLIQNEDYSSKTWAAESKSSADLSKMYSEAASLDLNNLENKIIEYDEQLNTTITEGVETIETLQVNSIAEITTNKESALSDITTAETNVLANIDTSKLNTLAQIEELANSSIEDINATGIDTKVSKSGDTMTGDLFVEKETPIITLKNSNIESSVPPTADSGVSYFSIHDKNGQAMGQVGLERYANGRQTIKLQAFSPDGTFAPAIRVHANADNTASFNLSANPATTSNGTDIATTNFVKSVLSSSGNGLATVKKASNGYIKFNNGIIMQWGRSSSGKDVTVTLPTPFSSATSYGVAIVMNLSSGNHYGSTIQDATSTSFHLVGSYSTYNAFWVAIGY